MGRLKLHVSCVSVALAKHLIATTSSECVAQYLWLTLVCQWSGYIAFQSVLIYCIISSKCWPLTRNLLFIQSCTQVNIELYKH